MIQGIQISNFRSVGDDVRVTLGPMTVLVGPNGSGKSNVVDALCFLSDCVALGLEGAVTGRHGISAVRRWSHGRPFNVRIAVQLRAPDFNGSYSFELAGDKTQEYRVKNENIVVRLGSEHHRVTIDELKWKEGPSELRPRLSPMSLALPLLAGDDRFSQLADELRGIAVYSIFPDELREPQKYDPVRPMRKHGENWVSLLKEETAGTWTPDLIAALHKLTNDIDDVRVQQVGGHLAVSFKHRTASAKQKKWFDATQESDGTLRVAGIITALLQEPPPTLIAIEEPELTVHAGALPLVNDYLQQAAKHSQVLITTHSPELLDLVEPENVRVVERRDGITTVTEMEKEQTDVVRRRLMSLGELQRTEGIKQLPLDLGDEG